MHIPSRFLESLRLEFDGRFRIRWSAHQQRLLIEEKITRGDPLGQRRPPGWMQVMAARNPDRLKQVVDGYGTVMVLSPTPRLQCPKCAKGVLKLSVQKMRSSRCPECAHESTLTYWPLDDTLLTHLRYIDVDRGWALDEYAAIHEEDRTKLQRVMRQSKGISRDMHKDDFTQLFGVPMSKPGQGRMWADAPESPHLRTGAGA